MSRYEYRVKIGGSLISPSVCSPGELWSAANSVDWLRKDLAHHEVGTVASIERRRNDGARLGHDKLFVLWRSYRVDEDGIVRRTDRAPRGGRGR